MVTIFSTSSTNVISGQPNSAGEKLILRSTSVDDGEDVTITGIVAAAPDSETVVVTGRIEVQTAKSFESVSSVTMSDAAIGIVTMHGQGVAASGDIRVDTVPATASTLSLGLTGNLQVYTFRSPARFTIQTVAFSAMAQADYIDLLEGATTKRYWFDKDNAGTGAPSNPGGGLFEIDISTGDTAATVATKFKTSLDAHAASAVSISSNTLTLTGSALTTGSAADGTGGHDTGFTITSVNAGTAAAANQIRTTYSGTGTAITTAQVAANISYAVNATGGNSGIDYTSDTVANAYLSATVLTSVVTVTDRLKIGRQIAWANTQSSSYLTIRQPTGASTSLAQATFRNTVTQLLTAAITLNTEDRTTATLPAGITPTSDWVLVGGKKFTIALSAAQTASALAFKYQTSQDRLTARDGDTSISITTTSATLSNRDKLINPSENAEYVRLVVTSNPNTLDTKVNAKLIA